MTKKTLEEKARLVGFWTFGFVFWYLLIAFFLKSSYPIYEYSFNRGDAYDAIKDALTLAAAFLAPVAAFVLFTDWRTQHNAIKLDKFNDDINYKIISLHSSREDIFYDIAARSRDPETFKDLIIFKYQKFNNELQEIRNIFSSFSFSSDKDAQELKQHISKLINSFDVSKMQLFLMKTSIFKLMYSYEDLSEEEKRVELYILDRSKNAFTEENENIQLMINELEKLRSKL